MNLTHLKIYERNIHSTFAISQSHSHRHLKEYVRGTDPWKIPVLSAVLRCLCILSTGEGLSLKEWGYWPRFNGWHLAVILQVQQTWELAGSERCPTQREIPGHSLLWTRRAQRVSGLLFIGHKGLGFSHSYFPSWSQFRYVTFSESLITKMLFRLDLSFKQEK